MRSSISHTWPPTAQLRRRPHPSAPPPFPTLPENAPPSRRPPLQDRRIGEFDESITEDERVLARFQRQRLRTSKSSRFALSDASPLDEHLTLTHGGAPLDFNDPDAFDHLSDLDDDHDGGRHSDGTSSGPRFEDLQFGGGSIRKEDPTRRRP